MIPANELRIGNWVNVPHGNVQIEKFVTGGAHFTDGNGGNFQSLDPIPLTPEILEKCGFIEKDRALLEPYGFRNFIHKKAVVQLGTNIIKTWVDKMNEPVEHILSFHQLQNLFFFHNDEELLVKNLVS